MSVPARAVPRTHATPTTAVVVLGAGGVGGTLLGQLAARRPAALRLVGLANSHQQLAAAAGLDPAGALQRLLAQGGDRDDAALLEALDASGARLRVIVDATASERVARRHPLWLGHGYHVVTANKALNGGSLADWHAIGAAARSANVRYGASATVGAGLPVIDTLRRWRLSGDRVAVIEGVFSGSLSWLFNQYDGSRPFSDCVREAQRRGYCEPDPRVDLGGVDVARKLLILARNAGIALDDASVRVESLVPEALRDVTCSAFERDIHLLDADIAARHAEARRRGRVLRHLARYDGRGARVGLVAIDPDEPAASLRGSDNLFVLTSASYAEQPLVIRGPGAGTTVTAQALLADILQLAEP